MYKWLHIIFHYIQYLKPLSLNDLMTDKIVSYLSVQENCLVSECL